MPVVPVLIAFAAFAAFRLYLGVRRKAYIRTTALALPLGGVYWSCATSPKPRRLQRTLNSTSTSARCICASKTTPCLRGTRAGHWHWTREYNYARHNLAVACFHQERYGESERAALQTLAENPRRIDTHILLGRIYLATDEPQQAATHLRRTLERDPDSGPGHYYYGRLLYRQGHYNRGRNPLAAGTRLATTGASGCTTNWGGPCSRPGEPRLHSASTTKPSHSKGGPRP